MGVALLLFVPPAALFACSFSPVASLEPSRGVRGTAAQQRAVARLRPTGRCRRDRSAGGLFPKRGDFEGQDRSAKDTVLAVLQRSGVHYFDLTSCIREVGPDKAFIAGRPHYSAEGNAAVAQCLLPAVRRQFQRDARDRREPSLADRRVVGLDPHRLHSVRNKEAPPTATCHRGFTLRQWARVELNYRPHAYQAGALTT